MTQHCAHQQQQQKREPFVSSYWESRLSCLDETKRSKLKRYQKVRWWWCGSIGRERERERVPISEREEREIVNFHASNDKSSHTARLLLESRGGGGGGGREALSISLLNNFW